MLLRLSAITSPLFDNLGCLRSYIALQLASCGIRTACGA